jgi:hypothetical protein
MRIRISDTTLLKVNVILDKAGQYIPPKRWNECLKYPSFTVREKCTSTQYRYRPTYTTLPESGALVRKLTQLAPLS